jgi:hypothetical protein
MTAGKITLGTGTAPGTPATGKAVIYFKSADKKPYFKDDAGTETPFALDGVVGPSNAVYVDIAGNDGSGARGDASKPFLTVAAGLAACQSGDVLYIGPGLFEMDIGENPVWPVGVNRLTIVGAGCDLTGVGGTRLSYIGADAADIFAPVSTAEYVEIRDLYAAVTVGSGYALNCDGTGASGSFLGGAGLTSGGLRLRNCCLIGDNAVRLLYVGLADINDAVLGLPSAGHTFQILTSTVLRGDGIWSDSVEVSWDDSDPDKPTLGNIGSIIKNLKCGSVSCGGQAQIDLFDSDIGSVNGSLGLSTSGTETARISGYFCKIEDIDFDTAGYEYPDTAISNKALRFEYCRIDTGARFKVAGAAAERLAVSLRGSILPTDVLSTEANDGVDLNLRGCVMDVSGGGLVTGGTGTVWVDCIARPYTTDGTSPDVFEISLGGLTFFIAPANVQVTASALSIGNVAVTSITATQITIAYENNVAVELNVLTTWN